MKKHLSPVVAIFAILTFFAATEVRVEAGEPPPPPAVSVIGSWVTGTTHAKESGTNRALVLIAHAEDNDDPCIALNSATYGGRSMTKVIEKATGTTSTSRAYAVAFILNEPNIVAATTTTFTPTWNQTPDDVCYISVFLKDVNQTVLVGSKDGNGVTNAALLKTAALSTKNGDMVIEGGTNTQTGIYTANNGFFKDIDLSGGSFDAMDGNKAATGVNETPSVTHSTTTNRQVLLGFVVQAKPIRKLTVSSSEGGTVTTPGIGDFNYADGNNASIVASASANYHFVNWTGTAVTAGKVANPDSPDATVLMDANYTVQANFAEGIHISGTITCGGLEVNEVNLMGLGVVTDANGFYTTTVDQGWSGTVTPAKSGYTFDPNSRSYTNVITDVTNQDYNALPADDFNDNRRGSMWRRSR